MKEYMTSLGTVLMLIAFANMLVPEGSIKKYVSLAMGFMLITAALSLFPGSIGEISFSAESFEISEEDMAAAQAEYRAKIIKEHRSNLKEKIQQQMKYGSKAYVEVSENGEIISVTLLLKGDESAAVSYIIESLGVPRERIKLKYDEN